MNANSTALHAQTPRYTQVLTPSFGSFRDREGADRSRPYANNLNAFWLIKPSNPLGTRFIVLRFDSLNTQRGRDVVRIFAGGSTQRLDTTRLLATISGAVLPSAIFIPDSAVTVQFVTDASLAGETRRDSATGWSINYSAFTNAYTAESGAFQDRINPKRNNDGLGNDYLDNLDALWVIRPNNAKQILLQFDSLNIEDEYDFVSVIAGIEEPRIIGQFTGSTLPPSLAINDSLVVVRFTTDSSVAGDDDRFTSGWTIRYISSTRASVIRPETDRIDFGAVNLGEESALQTLRLSGSSFLDDLTIIAPTGFKISTSATGAFSDTVRITTPKNSPVTSRAQIFIRFTPKTIGEFAERLTLRTGLLEESVTLVGLCKPVMYWESTGGPYSGRVTSLAVAAGNVLLAGTRSGVYRSNSNGAVWQASNAGLTAKGAQQVTFISASSGRNAFVYINTNAGLYTSTDTGKSWRTLTSNGIKRNSSIYTLLQYGGRLLAGTSSGLYQFSLLRNQWALAMKGFDDDETEIRSLAVHGSSIVAGTYNYGVYISNDSAVTWKAINSENSRTSYGIPTDGDYVVSGFASANGQLLAIVDSVYYDDYEEENVEYSEVYRTSNDGGEWALEDIDSINARNVYRIYNAVVVNEILYLGTDGGVARRRFVENATWNFPQDPTTVGFTEPTVESLVTNGSAVYAGTLGGVFRSTNQGVTWQPVNTGLTATRVFTMTNARGAIFAGTEGSGLFRSTDNGASWQTSNNGLRGVYIGDFAELGDALFTCTYNDRSTASWSRNGVYRSLDNGLTWSLTSRFPTSNTDPRPLSPQPDVLTINTDDRNVLYAGTTIGDEGFFYASTTNGVSWREISLPNVARQYPIYAIEDGPGTGVYIGTNGGGTYWSPNPLASSPEWLRMLFDDIEGDENYINALATFQNNLFAATSKGLYRLNAARTRWLLIPNAPRQITELAILSLHVAEGMLYAGISENGVWRSRDGLQWERVNEGFLTSSTDRSVVDVYALTNDDLSMYAGLDGNAIHRSSLTQGATAVRAFLELDDFYRANPGDTISIALKLAPSVSRNIPILAAAQMPTFSGILRFNASLLEPIDAEDRLQSVISNGERLINFRAQLKSEPQIRLTRDSVVKRFRFRALLGNSVATPLTLTNLSAQNISMLVRRSGLFTLTGLSDAGGTRLFVAESKPVVAVHPNPTSGALTVSVKTFEAGETIVSISNVFGQTVQTLASAELVPGDYDFSAMLAAMPQGVYFVSVQTPTQRVVRQVQVVK